MTTAESQYRMMAQNPMRTITRFGYGDRISHTDWNPLMGQYDQRSIVKNKENLVAKFKFRKNDERTIFS